jgi:hypothetical protein
MKSVLKTTTNRREFKILFTVDQDPYPEEYGEYRKHKRGFRGCWKEKPNGKLKFICFILVYI